MECYTLVSEWHGRQLRKRAECTTDVTSRRLLSNLQLCKATSLACTYQHCTSCLRLVLLRQCTPTVITGSIHSAASSAIESRHHYSNSSFPISIKTHCAAKSKQERESARPKACNRCCFCLYCYLFAPTLSPLPERFVLFICPHSPRGLPETEGEAGLCIHAPLLLPSTETPRQLLPSAQRPAATTAALYFPAIPSSLFVSSLLHAFCTTSSSPLRFSGHILCSFSQVKPLHGLACHILAN